MKITLRSLRKLIKEALLLEETCPACGSKDAYVGMRDVECPNKKCKFFSQRQAQDVFNAKGGKRTRLQELLDFLGLYGADSEGMYPTIDWDVLDVLKEKYGFFEGSDFGVGSWVISPEHWRIIDSLPPGAKDVIQVGSYDDILAQAVSPEAKALVHEAWKSPGIGNHANDYDYEGDYDNIPHWTDVVESSPELPFEKEEVRELLGLGKFEDA